MSSDLQNLKILSYYLHNVNKVRNISSISKRKVVELLIAFEPIAKLADLPDTYAVRAQEVKHSHIFRSTYRRLTAQGMHENRYYRIYENSFSRCRTRFDECGRVSLTSKKRR